MLSSNKIKTSLLVASIMIVFSACETNTTPPPAQEKNTPIKHENNETKTEIHLHINEVLASNKSTIQDPNFHKYTDYIELYNDDNQSLDISGFGLSDKIGGNIWKFPKLTTIEAKGFILVWADKKGTALHSNFKLSSDGESVILYDKKQKIIDKISFQMQDDDIAITRDTNNLSIQIKPTPNAKNDIKENQILDDSIQTPTSPLYINELMTRNTHTVMDSDFYAFSDWVELYNNSNQDINLSNYTLSDTSFQNGWNILTNSVIPSKGYLVIFLDKQNIPNHSDFSLSSTSGSLQLFTSNGRLLDKVNYKKQKSDISYGRDSANKHWGYMEPSFLATNKHTYSTAKRADKPHFSSADNNQTIMINTSDNSKIYFTKDGSTPTKTSNPYLLPIMINQTTVLKAVSYKDNTPPSKVQTQTYFKNFESTLPVISLSIENDYLFDDTIGIYADGTNGIPSYGCFGHLNDTKKDFKNFNQSWRRPVFFEYFDKNQNKLFDFDLDIAIAGQCSRYHLKKPFALDLNKKYGKSSLDFPLFNTTKDIQDIKDFKIRAGGRSYRIRDILSAVLAEKGGFDIDFQAYKAVRMFMNGQYWGLYNLRERKGKDFFASNYPNIDKHNIDSISHNLHGDVAKSGNKEAFNILYNYIKTHDLSQNLNYAHILTLIDEKNFIDYMALMTYGGSTDWIKNNTRFWRERKDGAKWRWMLDDLDSAFDERNINNDSFSFATSSSTLLGQLFKKLLTNTTFKEKFKTRYNTLLNTSLTYESLLTHINNLTNERKAYVSLEPNKWGIQLSKFQADEDGIKLFAQERPTIIRAQLNAL